MRRVLCGGTRRSHERRSAEVLYKQQDTLGVLPCDHEVTMKRHNLPNMWAYFRLAPDVPGQWEAHCLDLDVVTMGNSFTHAVHMLVEAIAIVVSDDIQNGRNPFDRKAPPEDWEPVLALIGKFPRDNVESLEQIEKQEPTEVALLIDMTVQIFEPSATNKPAEPPTSQKPSAPRFPLAIKSSQMAACHS